MTTIREGWTEDDFPNKIKLKVAFQELFKVKRVSFRRYVEVVLETLIMAGGGFFLWLEMVMVWPVVQVEMRMGRVPIPAPFDWVDMLFSLFPLLEFAATMIAGASAMIGFGVLVTKFLYVSQEGDIKGLDRVAIEERIGEIEKGPVGQNEIPTS